MNKLRYRSLDPSLPADLLDWQRVFRATPSFVFATEGRPPTDADAQRMLRSLPAGRAQEDIYAFAIELGGTLCGCAFVMKGYPRPEVAYLALLGGPRHHRRQGPAPGMTPHAPQSTRSHVWSRR